MYTPWSLRTRKIWLHNDVVRDDILQSPHRHLIPAVVRNLKLMKGKALRKHSLHEQTAASVLLKLFISSKPKTIWFRKWSCTVWVLFKTTFYLLSYYQDPLDVANPNLIFTLIKWTYCTTYCSPRILRISFLATSISADIQSTLWCSYNSGFCHVIEYCNSHSKQIVHVQI